MDLRNIINLVEARTTPEKLETTPLPYGIDDLNPVLSRDSLEYHYEHLARGYAKRYNEKQGDPNFNRAGSFLHNKFFPQFQAPKNNNKPRGSSLVLIEKKFKTFDDFKTAMKEKFMSIQGSGWVYLSTTGDIKTIANHAVRNDIALLIDAWEHAWALDYQWNKEQYFDNIWRIINWDIVNDRI
jgi:Fe-Mn family superoxide dismutase